MQINLERQHFLALIFSIMLVGGIGLVIGYGGSQPNIMGHTITEIDFMGFCVFSPTETACPTGWTRAGIFDGSTIRGSDTDIGDIGGSDEHSHTVDLSMSYDRASGDGHHVANDGLHKVFDTSSTSTWPPYVNVIVCCKD